MWTRSLKKRSLSIKDVFVMTVDDDRNYYIVEKHGDARAKNKKGSDHMKRLLIAAGLLVAAVGICTGGFVAMNKSVNKLSAILEEGREAVKNEDYFGAADIASSASQQWLKTKKLLEVFTNHHEVSELDDYFSMIEEVANDGDIEGFDDICTQTLYHLNSIVEAEKPLVNNIL